MDPLADRSHYRPDIQGLRAVAVLVVVVVHTGLPLIGGFVGVDIFFVISGFVITAALVARMEQGSLQAGRFYLARIRRLLPALAVMLTVVLLASMVLGAIGAMGITARTGAAAALINANTYLWLFDVGGYFDATSALNPLLHTWSLSVEEQFYLVFPALLAASWAIARQAHPTGGIARIRTMLVIVIAISLGIALALSVILTAGEAGSFWGRFTYYSPITRSWEFAAGALLAVTPALAPRSARARTSIGVLGAVLIVIALVTINESMVFPNALALIPVVGAVLVIAARTGPVSQVLSTRPMVWIGNLSYSWYLWHWPLIVFAGIWFAGALLPRVLAGIASLGVAWLSFRFVENPIRFRTNPTRRSTVLIAAVCVVVPLVSAFALAQWHAELKRNAQLNPFALHLDSLIDCDSPRSLDHKPSACTQGAADARGRAVLIGDSLAGQYAEAFTAGARQAGLTSQIATYSSCPFIDFGRDQQRARDLGMGQDGACRSFVRRTMADLRANPPQIVMVSAAAQRFIRTPTGTETPEERRRLDAQVALWARARGAMLTELADAGSQIIIIDPVPRFESWAPLDEGPFKESPAIRVLTEGSATTPSVPRAEAEHRLTDAIRAEQLAGAQAGATHLTLIDDVCGTVTCDARRDGVWVYRDNAHLSVATAQQLASRFAQVLEH